MVEEAAGDRVTVAVHDGVADVRLNRPDKLNALDGPMFDGLAAAAAQVRSDPSVRAVVLSGEGRGFCAGVDLAVLAESTDEAHGDAAGGLLSARPAGRITNRVQDAAWMWAQLPIPVIAAVHGVALGGGLQIILGADVRLVAPDAQLSVLEIRWGLIPDMTGTYLLPRLVGLDVAKELTWTGRMVGSDEAVRLGLATRVSEDPRREAAELARTIAAHSPDAVRSAKELLNRSAERRPEEQFAAEEAAMTSLVGSANQVEAVRAYFEQRPAVFCDPASP
ncbi:MAG: crotonase/enoyl-CoA hydratase family protein [Acidimicrobiales bacterium]